MLVSAKNPAPDVDELLRICSVRITKDAGALPRPGQLKLSHDIVAAMSRYGHLAGAAGTGTGKSLGYLVPAMLRAATRKERTVVSTDAIALQTQLFEKDMPLVSQVVAEETGHTPTFAVLKGFARYVCPDVATESGLALLTQLGQQPHLVIDPLVKSAMNAPVELDDDLSDEEIDAAMAARSESVIRMQFLGTALAKQRIPRSRVVTVADRDVDATQARDVIVWALDQASSGGVGDRADCPFGEDLDTLWQLVSTDTAGCAGADCPLYAMCPAMESRRRAAGADVVVTNHSMLAIQAATGAPIVFSSGRLGLFRHLVIDEAHALPGKVRNHAAKTIDGTRVRYAARAVEKITGNRSTTVELGFDIGDTLDEQVNAWLDRHQGQAHDFDQKDHPFIASLTAVRSWVSRCAEVLPTEDAVSHSTSSLRELRLVKNRLGSLAADAKHSLGEANLSELDKGEVFTHPEASGDEDGQDEALSGTVVHWVEPAFDKTGHVIGAKVCLSPVNVAPLVRGSLFETLDVPHPDDRLAAAKAGKPLPKNEELEVLPVSVTMVSATLPSNFIRESGVLVDKVCKYESPFETVYAKSMLYVPRLTEQELKQVTTAGYGGKLRLDPIRHATWAAKRMVEMTAAIPNHRVLVLSANANNGRLYAQTLKRAFPGRQVLSQWDAGDTQQAAAAWKDSANAVLVGTRTFMTGLDCPGRKLVIIDRPSRSAGNILDDARVGEAVAAGIGKWDADRLVYVSDASMLLEQASGRLVRSFACTGMVACLDPRLVKNGAGSVTYGQQTRLDYLAAFESFKNRTSDLQVALAHLRDLAAEQAA